MSETSGTERALSVGTPAPVCQVGLAKTTLAPPPPAAGSPGALSFQTFSGMNESAEPSVVVLVAFH